MTGRFLAIRVLALLSVLLGVNYVAWRWLASVNWEAWWIAVPLVIAETYSLIDTVLFAVTMWRARERPRPAAPPQGTVDVFITTYNEPLDMVMATALAAKRISYPHETWILDDGARPELARAAEGAGIGYLTRSADWEDKPRHAKAGNLNNALMETDGEFLLILDADQVPDPLILERTLGYFADDPGVALVQTPQWFVNVDEADPLGSQAPLFYGPIQQGKDGWNAAFFCGSNAILRRDALMQLGIVGYVRDLEASVATALKTAGRMLRRAASTRDLPADVATEVGGLGAIVQRARADLAEGTPIAEITAAVQAEVQAASRRLVEPDLADIRADVLELASLAVQRDAEVDAFVVDEGALDALAARELTPLGAIAAVDALMEAVRVDRPGEAQPVQPLATISVTEDMATAMQLHALGWKSVYHHEILAHGLAPEDLRTMLKQRLRWAQGTMQVLLRDNPIVKKGLSLGQRLMYFGTMWSYLSGFAAVIYIAAPIIYLLLGVLPVTAWSVDFFVRFLPYFVVNQILFVVVAKGIRTWRGQQYSLALFPVWIAACVTAFANVVFGRSLSFVVTRKDGRAAGGPPWREIWPQLAAMVLLAVSVVVGIGRVIAGTADGTGTLVNTVWVGYDLVVLSVLIQAARYQGYRPAEPAAHSRPLEQKEPPWTSP
ncbi:glycosyltransferase family 2 protein [Microbacterium oleivorans]|uniref:Glycosyltransferase n=1 Tax=Microbacterium oleivorans TaxID=273677 RepID=A0A4V6PNF4_9MICO|nr:glycosyltransferase family 2 protein [Microbacterium oleivorans]TDL42248.1 glycosyltransferase [Microbacterium oleivorans]